MASDAQHSAGAASAGASHAGAEGQVAQSQVTQFREDFAALREEITRAVVGQEKVIDAALVGLIAGGHVLLEGVPGLGKTLLARTIAGALDATFRRLQFTPDLMPADVIGTYIVMESAGRRKFEFQQGPLFANVVLADQINRGTPKTQSALLEAMAEGGATVANETYPLPRPFFLIATQNPLEMEGTFPLPEAQLDRFLLSLRMQMPGEDELDAIVRQSTEGEPEEAEPAITGKRLLEMSALARQVPVASDVRRYAIRLTLATHPENSTASNLVKRYVRYGAGPRAAQAMVLAAKARALISGRLNASRDDIQAVAHDALRHRLILNFDGHADRVDPDAVVDDVIKAAE